MSNRDLKLFKCLFWAFFELWIQNGIDILLEFRSNKIGQKGQITSCITKTKPLSNQWTNMGHIIRFWQKTTVYFIYKTSGGFLSFSTYLLDPQTSLTKHSVLEQIWIKGSYLDQRLPQHESLYPIGLILARIKIPHVGKFFT